MEAENYLLQIPMWTRNKNTLLEIRCFLEELGNPDDRLSIIHVAGTNGKGSVCAFLTSILTQAGYLAGTFTSPHLVNIRERLSLNGVCIDQTQFQQTFEVVYALTKTMMERGFQHPTFYEFLFLMAVVWFREKRVDYVILETGLGGRLDATNVIRHPLITVITSISLDHTEYLGDTIEKIGVEKAGIIKPGVPVVYDKNEAAAAAVICEQAKVQKSVCCGVGWLDLLSEKREADAFRIQLRSANVCRGTGEEGSAVEFLVPFLARYQVMNAMLAYRVIEILSPEKADLDKICEGIKKTRWPGRMEAVLPGVFLDGAHNPGGAAAAADAIDQIRKYGECRIMLLFAAASDKAHHQMAEILGCLPWQEILVVSMNNKRGMGCKALAEIWRQHSQAPILEFEAVDKALSYAFAKKSKETFLFCLGSLYLVGEIKELLHKNAGQGCGIPQSAEIGAMS